jgi:hypothetical protein
MNRPDLSHLGLPGRAVHTGILLAAQVNAPSEPTVPWQFTQPPWSLRLPPATVRETRHAQPRRTTRAQRLRGKR